MTPYGLGIRLFVFSLCLLELHDERTHFWSQIRLEHHIELATHDIQLKRDLITYFEPGKGAPADSQ